MNLQNISNDSTKKNIVKANIKANIIEAKGISFSYDYDRKAIDNINIEIKEDSVTAILGGNGAGKSTLFLILNAILRPNTGNIYINGKPVKYDKKSVTELRKRVGLVFQDPDDQIFSSNVYQDISFGAMNLKLPLDEVKKRVELAMEQVSIAHLKDRPTHSLSFGQKKRVAIAGVLVMQPEVIILDEPTAGLDPSGISDIMHLLGKIRKESKTAVVIATHDIDMVPLYCDYAYVLDNGRIAMEGTPDKIFENPNKLREHYLRLTRIGHLMEILHDKDGLDILKNTSTIANARKEILKLVNPPIDLS